LSHNLAHATIKGATAYTTLEPCTSRGHDKMPCAAWLINDVDAVAIFARHQH
jgi:pyrimidine deaminase RibD-like protein